MTTPVFLSTQAVYINIYPSAEDGWVTKNLLIIYIYLQLCVVSAGNLGADWQAGTTTTHGFLPNPHPDFLVYLTQIYCTINRRFPAGFPF